MNKCDKPIIHTLEVETSNWPIYITCATILTILVVVVGCLIVIHNRNKERRSRNMSQIPIGKDLKNGGGHFLSLPSRPCDIFLLYFPESESFADLNKSLRNWLISLECKVYDLSDDTYGEEIAEAPESWAENIIKKPNTKVIVVNSPRAEKALASNLNDDEEGDLIKIDDNEEEEEAERLINSTSDSFMVEEDNLDDLRISSLRHLRAHYSGNYKKLSVISYSFYDSSLSSSNLSNNRTSKSNSSSSHVLNLTPQMQLRLPDHLGTIKTWIKDHSIMNGSSSAATATTITVTNSDSCSSSSNYSESSEKVLKDKIMKISQVQRC